MTVRPLRQILSLQATLVAVVPFFFSALLCLIWILPQINADLQTRQRQLASMVASQMESYLASAGSSVSTAAAIVLDKKLPGEHLPRLLDALIESNHTLGALYAVNGQGRVVAVGLPPHKSAHRADLLGLDLSRSPLFIKAVHSKKTVLSDTFLSLVGGGLSVAVAMPADSLVFFGEVEPGHLTTFLKQTVSAPGQLIVILDRHGQVIADQNGRFTAQQLNLSNLPLVRQGLQSAAPVTGRFTLDGRSMTGTMLNAADLGWEVLIAVPTLTAYRSLLTAGRIAVAGIFFAVLVAIVVAVLASRRLSRRFEGLANHARSIAQGEEVARWQGEHVTEFDQLASDLQQMAGAIRDRERRLFESERLLQSVMDNTFELQWLLATDGRLIDVNRTALNLAGKEKDEVIGSYFRLTPWWSHDPLLQEQLAAAMQRSFAGEFVRFESTLRDTLGELRFIDCSLNPLFDAGGKVTYLIAEGRDITDRKRVEQSLEREKYFTDTVIESLPVTFFVRDQAGFVRWNKALEEVSGLTADELRKSALLNMIHDDDRALVAAKAGEALSGGHAEVEARVLTTAGIRHHFITSSRMAMDDDVYLVGAAIDITARKEAENKLLRAYDTTIEGWARALDLRDKETEGHSRRVTEMTERLARAVGVPPEEIVQMRRGALLHDIGKLGVPDRILLKPDVLTDEEMKIMKEHPWTAYQLLAPIDFLRGAVDIPFCHHERWDGGGYPRGLKGEEIPLAARIFAVIDVWDALSSDRPYRAAWPAEKVLAFIGSQSGSHFDPAIVETFMEIQREQRPPAPAVAPDGDAGGGEA